MRTCAQIEPLLDDYADDVLAADDAAAVDAHLKSCTACGQAVAALRGLMARTGELPESIAPSHDLWYGIAERIASPVADEGGASNVTKVSFGRQGAPRHVWRRALGIAAALLLTVVGLYYGVYRAGSGSPYLAAEGDYVQARADLLAAIDERKESLAPETLAAVEENLQVIDQAVSEIRVAMDNNPQDARLAGMLVATREKEMDFLQQVVRIP